MNLAPETTGISSRANNRMSLPLCLLVVSALLFSASACATTKKSINQPEPATASTPLKIAIRSTVSLVVETDSGDSFGAGVLFDNQGHILTVHHAIVDAHRIVVLADGGFTTTATVVGADPIADIALLKVTGRLPESLQPAKFTQKLPQAGDKIWSIGNPFGTSRFGGEPSISGGIISARGRSYFNDDTGRLYLDALQHDAPTNPGNSGGGVFDTRGQLVGINALITTMHGSASDSGVAFAIPAHMLTSYATAMLAGTKLPHGWFGEERFRQATDVRTNSWGRIRTVFGPIAPDGPGALRGIMAGDVIIRVGGQEVFGLHEVLMLEDSIPPGKMIKIIINRGGIEIPINITVGNRPWYDSR